MAWDFLKKLVSKPDSEKEAPASPARPGLPPAAPKPPPSPKAPAAAVQAAPAKEKPASEKTDDELAAELDKMSPDILAQAKDPQMRALIIGIYRKMLVAGVDVTDDKEVKKWMKKHPEVMQGGETVRVATVRREEPKIGRNDPCTCGSGKKYKKCCGAGK
jgi:hypothetical protein